MVLSTPNSHHPNFGDLPNAPSLQNIQTMPHGGLAKSSLATIENQSIVEEDRGSPSVGLKTQYVNSSSQHHRFSSVNMSNTLNQNSDKKFFTKRRGLGNAPTTAATTTLGGHGGSQDLDSSHLKTRTAGFDSTRQLLNDSTGLPVSLNSIKKSRKLVDDDVLKLHNRIRMLQLEEDRALKKIDETRRKAKNILELRLHKDRKVRRHSRGEDGGEQPTSQRALSLSNRPLTPDGNFQTSIFFERKEEHRRIMHERLSQIMQKRLEDATLIKKERKVLTRRKLMIEKAFTKANQMKRLEVQEQTKEGAERIEMGKKQKLDDHYREKEREIREESRYIKKKERMARKLELAEAEILMRLKETHE